MIEGSTERLNGLSTISNTYHGRTCKVCGETLRYKRNKRCVECKHQIDAALYQQSKARKQAEQRHGIEAE